MILELTGYYFDTRRHAADLLTVSPVPLLLFPAKSSKPQQELLVPEESGSSAGVPG